MGLRVARSSHDSAPHRRRRGLPPQVTASPSRGSGPDPASRAGAASLPRLWASRAGFSAPAALSNPLCTLRKRISGNDESQREMLRPLRPSSREVVVGCWGLSSVARAPAGSPGAERRGKGAHGERVLAKVPSPGCAGQGLALRSDLHNPGAGL